MKISRSRAEVCLPTFPLLSAANNGVEPLGSLLGLLRPEILNLRNVYTHARIAQTLTIVHDGNRLWGSYVKSMLVVQRM